MLVLLPLVVVGLMEHHGIRAFGATTDNVGLFFGVDIFVSFGAVALMASICAR